MKKKIINVVSVTLAVFSILLIGYYIIFPSRGEFTSDFTDTIMWAKASVDSGTLFNSQFYYAALFPFGGQLIMIPFVLLFNVSMTAQILGMLTFTLLFILTLFFLGRAMKWNIAWISALIINFLLILALSAKLREIFYGHIIYYSLGVFFTVVGMIFVFHLNTEIESSRTTGVFPKKRFLLFLVFSALWFLLASANGIMAGVLFSVPLMAGIFFERMLDTDTPLISKANLPYILYFSIIVLAVLLGNILGRLLIGKLVAGYADAYSTFQTPSNWSGNLENLLPNWVTLFKDFTGGTAFASLDGIKNLLIIFLSAAILVYPLIMLFFYRKLSQSLRVMLIAFWMMTFLIIFGAVFGSLNAANWRLSPIIAFSVLLSTAFIKWLAESKTYKRFAPVVAVLFLAGCLISADNLIHMPENYNQTTGLYPLTQFLENNRLSYGYATFWNANSITVISDSKVKVRAIEINNTQISPRLYQTESGWYKNQPDTERYFLLLSESEYQSLNPLYQADSISQFDCQGYVILVFDHNLF